MFIMVYLSVSSDGNLRNRTVTGFVKPLMRYDGNFVSCSYPNISRTSFSSVRNRYKRTVSEWQRCHTWILMRGLRGTWVVATTFDTHKQILVCTTPNYIHFVIRAFHHITIVPLCRCKIQHILVEMVELRVVCVKRQVYVLYVLACSAVRLSSQHEPFQRNEEICYGYAVHQSGT